MSFNLSVLDLTIIIASLVVTVSTGLWAARRQDRSARGYFLASGRLPWYIIGAAYVSTSVSSEQIVGTIGAAYTHGMGVANFEWFALPHYLVLILFFVPIFLKNRITTVPELLTRRYGPLCGDIYSWVMMLAFVFVFMVPVVYGGSLAFATLTGWNFHLVLWVMVVLVAAYAIKGGLSAVMWTDAVQCTLLVGGGVLLFFAALKQTPGGWGALLAANPERFHLYRPPDDPVAPFLAIVSFVFTGGVFYCAGNQIMMQRILGARSEWDGIMGVIFAGFVNVIRPLVTCFPGFIVYYWITHLHLDKPLRQADTAFPFLLNHLQFGWGLRGIILAGFLAAVMSTISAQANSTATIFSLEVWGKLVRRGAPDAELVRVGRYASLAALAIAALMAPLVAHMGGIFNYFQTGVTYLATPFSAVIILGVLWKRANYPGAVFGLLGGIVIQIAVVLGLNLAGFHLHWMYNGFIAQAITMIGVVVVSLATPPPPESSWRPLVWNLATVRVVDVGTQRPWYKSLRLWFLIYFVVWACLYWRYW